METFLPAKYDHNSTGGSKITGIYVIFGQFLFWSVKHKTAQKKLSRYKILFLYQ